MKIPLFKIYHDEHDVESVSSVIKSGMQWAIGPSVKQFEQLITQYLGIDYCVTFNSGTSALHAILLAHSIHKGDEIIVPSLTFIATANAPLFVGARPVFADVDQQTLGLDPDQVLGKVTSKTKAIIPVHYGGCPAPIQALKEIADDHNLILIEDAAESFGAKIDDQMTGTFGQSSMLSFCQNKIITTGEGGAIVTNSKEIYQKLRLIRSHGRMDDSNYFTSAISGDYVELGYNFRLSNINAALGVSQLQKVEPIISMRQKAAHYYIENLKTVEEIILPFLPSNIRHVFQLFSIRVKNGRRDALIDFLRKRGIMTKVYFSPVHLTHQYKNVLGYTDHLPVTESIAKEILSIPIDPAITEKELNYVIASIKSFYESE
ncbi:MAG: DegT/DnrJ/EryC1/StrS family aminotransferase [Candidatus Odinarchaeota archaeon]